MAITRYDYLFWKELRDEVRLPTRPAVLELGQANWFGDLDAACLVDDVRRYADPGAVDRLLARLQTPDSPREPLSFIQAEVFYRAVLRAESMTAVDLHGTPRALPFDLNQPLDPLGSSSVIINTGTAEHVFDQAQFCRTCHDLCSPGGLMVHMMPAWGWPDHGFYNYHPTFAADLAASNGYEIVKWWVYDLAAGRKEVVRDPSDVAAYLKQYGPAGSTMYAVCYRKPAESRPFRTPMQGYYTNSIDRRRVAAWHDRDWSGERLPATTDVRG